MDRGITLGEFIIGLLTVLVPTLYNMYKAQLDSKNNKPLTTAQSESAMGDALGKLGQSFANALETIASQDKELAQLRPLVLDISIERQKYFQCTLDKDDWKTHALKLETQVKELNGVPIVFKRQSLEGDSDKMKAITQEALDQYIKGKNVENNGKAK